MVTLAIRRRDQGLGAARRGRRRSCRLLLRRCWRLDRLDGRDRPAAPVQRVHEDHRVERPAGVSYGRDFSADLTGDIAEVTAGRVCASCGGILETRRGIEAANTFKLGAKYSATMGATFRDEDGTIQPLVMGCYGLGVTRLLACILEQHHDDAGIIWPSSVAPYAYTLLAVGADPETRESAEALYTALGPESTLYDDRDLSAGVKFADADLLGMPVRITVSARSLAAGGAELRARSSGETRIVSLADAPQVAREMASE